MIDTHLYHYYEEERGPFKNLSALSDDEAQRVLGRIKKEGAVFAARRSDDYMKVRRELEHKARSLFIQNGGNPTNPYPHYMTLGPCDWLLAWYKHGSVLQLPLEAFDPHMISFTYGDLFPTMRYQDGKPYRGQIYTLTEIENIIEQYGWPQEWNPDGSGGPERYIEVQVWCDVNIPGGALHGWSEGRFI